MSTQQVVYIDTNVFALILLPHPPSQNPRINQAKNFILDIESGKYRGITSTLTETEFRGVAKKTISKVKKGPITLAEEKAAMDNLIRFIQQLGIGLMDADLFAGRDISGRLKIFRESGNTVRRSQPILVNNEWRMIRSVDSLMISIAKRIGAVLFATFDQGFKGFKDSIITPLIISDVY